MAANKRSELLGSLFIAAAGGAVGAIAATPTTDAVTALLWAAGGAVIGGVAGTVAAVVLALMVRPAWHRTVLPTGTFLAGAVFAAAAALGLAAFLTWLAG
jgi:hypothetical protein